jgi:hypothetical protein
LSLAITKSPVSLSICTVGTYVITKKQLFYWHSACLDNLHHMKIRTVPTTKFALLCAALGAALLMFADKANAFTIRDADASPGHGDRSSYVDHLGGMPIVRSDERANGQYFHSGNLTPHIVLPNHMDARKVDGRSVEVITIPSIGGVPSPGTPRVPDGGITAMLLGTALGALGIARRYIRT